MKFSLLAKNGAVQIELLVIKVRPCIDLGQLQANDVAVPQEYH